MPSKTTFLAGFATGYVLGARAGRERYEQIMRSARSFANNPKVQETAGTLQTQAVDLAASAKDKVTSRRSGSETETYEVVEMRGIDEQAGSNGRIGI
jgi:hypothetical protein